MSKQPVTPLEKHDELKDTNYELFIVVLSILSIINLVWGAFVPSTDIAQVLLFINALLSLLFFFDFLYRLFSARSKRHYFIRQFGWLDLLSALPLAIVKVVRILRIVRVVSLLRRAGSRQMLREFLFDRAGSAILTVFFLIVLVLEFASVSILRAESTAVDANITNASDALWWTIVTVSTVGYGDQFPVTNDGRLIGVLVIIIGVGLFGVLTGYLSNRFLSSDDRDATDAGLESVAPQFAAILDELAQLRQAHTRTETVLLARIAELEGQLAGDSSDPG